MNTCIFLQKAARQNPATLALIHGDEQITYDEFYQRALTIGGNLLALGLKAGDRVAFCLANSPRILETIYGCFAAGLVVVPTNARLHAKEIAYIVGNSGAKVLIHGAEFQDGIVEHIGDFAGVSHRICLTSATGAATYETLLDPAARLAVPVEVAETDPCWLFYTSGTTGRPKGATWTHRTVRVVIMNYLADLHNIQPGEVVVHAAPMSHGSGIIALPAVARGATNVIFENKSFEPKELFALIERMRVSHIAFLAPTQIIKMLEEFEPGKYDLSSLRAICFGGAPIYVEHLRNAIKAFGPVFTQLYGQGESPITITGMNAAVTARMAAANDPRIGSTGTIRTDVEARVVDANDQELPPGQAGEVVVRGDIVMAGYWNNPEATAEAMRNGWLHTGDIGAFDENGYLFLLDRAKDMIISGGNNVYPREVEEVIVAHPAVANVVVFGIPDAYWGEAVHAVVECQPGMTVTAEEIIKHCGNNMAGYKKPKAVDFMEKLPVSGYGKVMRKEIRETYWVGHEGRIGGGGPTQQSVKGV
ncbi:MAG: AMP-binding protein [Rhodocyclaceae bacterium]|nr:AMP-binding protein [Rhodocyclaceae bacterium]